MLSEIYESKTWTFSGATGLTYAGGGARGKDGLNVQEDEDNDVMFEQDSDRVEDSGGSEDDRNLLTNVT